MKIYILIFFNGKKILNNDRSVMLYQLKKAEIEKTKRKYNQVSESSFFSNYNLIYPAVTFTVLKTLSQSILLISSVRILLSPLGLCSIHAELKHFNNFELK